MGAYNNTDMFYLQEVVLVTTWHIQIQPSMSVNPA